MGKKQQQTPAYQTVNNVTTLPDWVNSAATQGLAEANTTANNLGAPAQTSIAGLNGDQNAAFGQVRSAAQQAQPGIQAAQQTAQGAANYDPQQIGAQKFTDANLQAYMSPFIDNVESKALNALDLQRQQALSGIGSQAAAAKAFGGSRQGVMEGVTNAEAARQAGELSANLRSNAFNAASGLITGDQSRQLQADAANQSAGLQANQQSILGASTAGQLAAQGQQSALQGASALQATGNAQQAQQQAVLDNNAANQNALRNYPLEQLSIKQNALGVTPYGKSSSTTGLSGGGNQPANPALGALGGAMSGLSIASSLGAAAGSGGSFLGGGLGALTGLLALSDETMKTDKAKVGKDPNTGLDLYAYRYKGDPKSYPKVIGPMAQDIEKKFPDQVTTLPGSKKKAVNLGFPGMRGMRGPDKPHMRRAG